MSTASAASSTTGHGIGATSYPNLTQDFFSSFLAGKEMLDVGLMYERTVRELDGHQWEVLWMSSEMPAG